MRSHAGSWSCLLGVALASLAASASAVTIEWTAIDDPGNACDAQSQGCFGAVGYAYGIATYEVTNAEYAEFLNAKAASDPLGLYNADMGTSIYGGITQAGSSGSYSYSVIAGRSDMPVNFVSFYDALRFANWLHNGQGAGDTETGAYTLLGGTATPSNGTAVARNTGATIFVASEDEWYKAAYYSALTTSYFDYPAGSDAQTTCASPTATANHANCDSAIGDLTIRGSYPGSASPYGTFDQGGNVWEWNETIVSGSDRGIRGGVFINNAFDLASGSQNLGDPALEHPGVGFRVAMLPEPGTALLGATGTLCLLGLVRWRRRSA
jgi:formylglycine-generating enzyme required for sulfatase activity